MKNSCTRVSKKRKQMVSVDKRKMVVFEGSTNTQYRIIMDEELMENIGDFRYYLGSIVSKDVSLTSEVEERMMESIKLSQLL